MLAKGVTSEGVSAVAESATAYQAAVELVNARVGAVPALDKAHKVVGEVSKADLVRRAKLDSMSPSIGVASRISRLAVERNRGVELFNVRMHIAPACIESCHVRY